MSHIDDDLLAAFARSEVGEHLAVHVALHLDTCPQCSARAAALDPLTAVFAGIEDVSVPKDLVASILAADAAGMEPHIPEISVGLAMLATAGVMLVGSGEVWSWLQPVRSLVSGLVVAAQHAPLTDLALAGPLFAATVCTAVFLLLLRPSRDGAR